MSKFINKNDKGMTYNYILYSLGELEYSFDTHVNSMWQVNSAIRVCSHSYIKLKQEGK